jgi:Tfp pilus assembly protein PilP
MKRLMTSIAVVLLSAALVATVVAQQTPAGSSASAAAAQVQQNLEGLLDEPIPENQYQYDPQGRRDPFRSLVSGRSILRENAPPGVAGFLIEEIDLQGVIRTRQGLAAVVRGPDNNGYLLRVGERVFDGEVVRLTQNAVIFRQETREIVRELAQSERRR